MNWQAAKDLAARMFAIDAQLTPEAANRNHNLAGFLKLAGNLADRPEKLARVTANFDRASQEERMQAAMPEIQNLDPELARDLTAWLAGE